LVKIEKVGICGDIATPHRLSCVLADPNWVTRAIETLEKRKTHAKILNRQEAENFLIFP